jgi:hypothetical protein
MESIFQSSSDCFLLNKTYHLQALSFNASKFSLTVSEADWAAALALATPSLTASTTLS